MSPSARFDRGHTDDLMTFLAASPSPYHAVANAAERLEKAGFRQVLETDAWDGTTGGKYVLRGGAIIAWYVPEGADPHTPFRIIGAHTDSPNLRVKPMPDTGSYGCRQIAVEIYGGTLLNTWLDRDLGLAGRITLRDGSHRLVNVDRALLRVPQLAVHLDRSVNDGLKLDRQRHMQPIWGLGKPEEGDLIRFVAEEAEVERRGRRRLGPDAVRHRAARLPRPRPRTGGRAADGQPAVGARGDRGGGRCLPPFPPLHPGARRLRPRGERLAVRHRRRRPAARLGPGTLGVRPRRHLRGPGAGVRRHRSACRPTSATPCTPTTRSGTTRRTTRAPTAARSSRSTSTSGTRRTAADARCSPRRASGRACRWQSFVSNNALPCGTTIGPITAARHGIQTVDVGVAILSMHSARELCGADDPYLLANALVAFLEG